MRISLLQLNFHVGDLAGNAAKIIDAVQEQADQNIDLFVTSELALLGYPPKDLLLNQDLVRRSQETLAALAQTLKNDAPILVGNVEFNRTGRGKPLFNSCFLLEAGNILRSFHKKLLPNYDVFDEVRYFESSDEEQVLEFKGKRIGITICEDIWNDRVTEQSPLYRENPVESLRQENVDLLINLSSSPFAIRKQSIRENMLSGIAVAGKIPVIYVNQIGGNDDLVFDGRSCAFDEQGQLIARAKAFAEDSLIVDLQDPQSGRKEESLSEEEEIWNTLVLGTRDYLTKCGFHKAVLGLSGGIDSALTAVIAAEAIGAENVTGVLMPSPYSSQGSIDDSLKLAELSGIKTHRIPIAPMMEAFDKALAPVFEGYEADTTEENIQARIRGNLLMAMSNKHGALLLTTGNKSELSVGYCTIYGDMSGGLAVISDLPKMLVYRLCTWVNKAKGNLIPENIITKPPSAELRPDQTDQDNLPSYEILDAILRLYIEKHKSAEQIIAEGFDSEIVNKIVRLVRLAEFKRKQAAPGIKVTDQAFGTGWRMPVAAKRI